MGGSKPGRWSLSNLAAGLSLGGDRGPGRPVAGLPTNSLSGYQNRQGTVSSWDLLGRGDRAMKVIRYMREMLLSLRPVPKERNGWPGSLRRLEGLVVVLKAPQDPGESALKVLFSLSWPRRRRRKGKGRRGQETRGSLGQSRGMPTEAAADFSQFGESWEDDRFPVGRTGWEPGIFVYES